MTQFYTYLWLREKDATPYYVGKGKGRRAFWTHKSHGVNRPKSDHLIVVQHWESEEKAIEKEKWWISFWGRKDLGTGILHNRTDGGDGISGISEEASKRRSESSKKMWETRDRTFSDDHKRKLSENWNREVVRHGPRSEETKDKLTLAFLGTGKGYHWKQKSQKWESSITYKGIYHYLGSFVKEEDAKATYEKALEQVLNGETPTKVSTPTKGRPWTVNRRAAENKKASGRLQSSVVGVSS